jgi:hypothetical protein
MVWDLLCSVTKETITPTVTPARELIVRPCLDSVMLIVTRNILKIKLKLFRNYLSEGDSKDFPTCLKLLREDFECGTHFLLVIAF